MALTKILTSENGIVTTYHKVGMVRLNNSTLSINLDSYVSKEYRENESLAPADNSFFRVDITVAEEESMGIRQLAYAKIKEQPGWEDAEDC